MFTCRPDTHAASRRIGEIQVRVRDMHSDLLNARARSPSRSAPSPSLSPRGGVTGGGSAATTTDRSRLNRRLADTAGTAPDRHLSLNAGQRSAEADVVDALGSMVGGTDERPMARPDSPADEYDRAGPDHIRPPSTDVPAPSIRYPDPQWCNGWWLGPVRHGWRVARADPTLRSSR